MSSCFRQGELGQHQITTKRLIEAQTLFSIAGYEPCRMSVRLFLRKLACTMLNFHCLRVMIEGNWSNFGPGSDFNGSHFSMQYYKDGVAVDGIVKEKAKRGLFVFLCFCFLARS